MDFGRSIKKRAKLMDKKLDEIVPNPYQGQVKHNYSKVKKPLFITFGTAAACACIAFGSIGVIEILKPHNDNKGNVIINPHPQPKPDPDKPQPYTGKTPTINIKDYVSANFGFPEFSYFSFFANNLTQTKMMAPYGDIIDNEEKEYTTMSPMDSYYDDEGRIHEPLPICETYSFSDFLYFEFEAKNDSFLEGKIGNGLIQALSVHTSVYDEDILILKNGNKFYSCLGNGKSNDSLGNITKLEFSAHKYIEDWDIIKDMNNEMPLTIYFKTGKGYEGAAVMEINDASYDIVSDSVFYLDYSFGISVNKVRKFIGLDPDPRFEGKQIDLAPKEIIFNQVDSFVLEEFGNTPFVREIMTGDGTPMYRFNGEAVFLDYFCSWRESISFFAADVNNDGYRDFVYTGKDGNKGFYRVIVYDYHNNVFMKETVDYRYNAIWFIIHNNALVAYQCNGMSDPDEEVVYDYADIVCDNVDNTKVSLVWRNIYQVDVFDFDRLTNRNGDQIDAQYDGANYFYTVNKNEDYNFVIVIKRYSQNLDIQSFTPENAGVSCIEVNHQAGFYASGPYTEVAVNYYSFKMRFTEGDYEICFTLSGLETEHLIIRAR